MHLLRPNICYNSGEALAIGRHQSTKHRNRLSPLGQMSLSQELIGCRYLLCPAIVSPDSHTPILNGVKPWVEIKRR